MSSVNHDFVLYKMRYASLGKARENRYTSIQDVHLGSCVVFTRCHVDFAEMMTSMPMQTLTSRGCQTFPFAVRNLDLT